MAVMAITSPQVSPARLIGQAAYAVVLIGIIGFVLGNGLSTSSAGPVGLVANLAQTAVALSLAFSGAVLVATGVSAPGPLRGIVLAAGLAFVAGGLLLSTV